MSPRDEGWAPFHRRLFSSPVWRGRSAHTKVVLMWVIGRVRHSDTPITPAGSIDCKMRQLCEECDLSDNTARRALADLTDQGFLAVLRSPHSVRITVLEWRSLLATDTTPNTRANYLQGVDLGSEPHRERRRTSPNEDRIITEKEEEGSGASHQVLTLTLTNSGGERVDGYKETVAAFHNLFVTAYDSKPTWTAAHGAQLKRLINEHGADEVRRRITILFTAAPSWITPPFTFNTLVRHFDALVSESRTSSARRGGMSPEEIMRARGSR